MSAKKSVRNDKTIRVGDVIRNPRFRFGMRDGTAKFVVEKTLMDGGQPDSGKGCYDYQPDGMHVYARRLSTDGSYDSNGELIDFYMSNMIDSIPEVELLAEDFTIPYPAEIKRQDAYALAEMSLKSDLYAQCAKYRQAVDRVLSWAKPGKGKQPKK